MLRPLADTPIMTIAFILVWIMLRHFLTVSLKTLSFVFLDMAYISIPTIMGILTAFLILHYIESDDNNEDNHDD